MKCYAFLVNTDTHPHLNTTCYLPCCWTSQSYCYILTASSVLVSFGQLYASVLSLLSSGQLHLLVKLSSSLNRLFCLQSDCYMFYSFSSHHYTVGLCFICFYMILSVCFLFFFLLLCSASLLLKLFIGSSTLCLLI